MNALKTFNRYLLWFANEHVDFRLAEIQAIMELYKIKAKWLEKPSSKPYWLVELPNENDAIRIASRSVTMRYIIELWGGATSMEDLHTELKSMPESKILQYCEEHLSFKVKVECYGNSQTAAEKVEKIDTFNYLPLKGKVKLKNPDVTFNLIEYWGMEPNNLPSKPYNVFFGRLIAHGQRDLITELSLKTRKFIGNTSMNSQLSLIMANQAKVQPGDLVFDPFVGSGSLLVAAAYYGAYVLGSDIDYLMLHGKTKQSRKQTRDKPRVDESIFENMKQYKCQSRYVDVVVADAALPPWRSSLVLDAIITDMPYGIRESAETIGSTKIQDGKHVVPENEIHIPSKIEYDFSKMLEDLFKFSLTHLKVGGRLVTWLPVLLCDYDPNELPMHRCLNLVSNCEQKLSTFTSRRLLTYEKIKEPELHEVGAFTVSYGAAFREKFYRHAQKLQKERAENRHNNREIVLSLSEP